MKENDRTLSIKICKKELKSFGQQRNNLAFARNTAVVAPSLQFLLCCRPISACCQNGATVLVFTDNFNFVIVDNGLPRSSNVGDGTYVYGGLEDIHLADNYRGVSLLSIISKY